MPPAATAGEGERGPSYLMVLAKAALAGGLASSASVLALHPIDTLKTRVQSTPGATIRGIAASAPKIGARGLYRGIIPAVGGTHCDLPHAQSLENREIPPMATAPGQLFTCCLDQDNPQKHAAAGSFVSHGARTLSYEAAAAGLGRVLGGAAELQVCAVHVPISGPSISCSCVAVLGLPALQYGMPSWPTQGCSVQSAPLPLCLPASIVRVLLGLTLQAQVLTVTLSSEPEQDSE